ncbi:hypothetical protein BZG36_02551 [Bifiguratus adelaidae]|uniref:Mitochondrial basic amino acids transporter n=1 Tax=Bifiguratus adelaidae TaxID=1938954 RepID=A0A261Y273_9FUNG|nr:hypothetical protein BZG36_02551 [Bifiguratus adelaidae]
MLEVDELPETVGLANTWHSFVAGIAGGLAGLLVGHPFDTVKVRLQSKELAASYKGTWHCFSTIIGQEKFVGLYKGMASPAVGVAVTNAFVFGVYAFLIDVQLGRVSDPQKAVADPSLLNIFFAGVGTGIANSLITSPMELVKIRLQNQRITPTGQFAALAQYRPNFSALTLHHSSITFNNKSSTVASRSLTSVSASSPSSQAAFSGPSDCIVKTLRHGGIRAFYKGLFPTIMRETSFGPYFLSYELLCRSMQKDKTNTKEHLSGPKLVLAGGAAGIAAWCSTYAADVVKTRIQNEPLDTPNHLRYKGFIDCAKRCYQEEGARVFFKGLNATLIRAFPCNAATFLAYTWTMRSLT